MNRFAQIAFTPAVKAVQAAQGSRAAYARGEADPASRNAALTEAEAAFLADRDSLYIASVGETGWPYIQHRGGPRGFVRVLDPHTIGFADYRGNRQYINVGNLSGDDRVSLFAMDYPNRRRLKLLGRARTVGPDEPELLARLSEPEGGRVERGIVIRIEGFDWNCPQWITPRFTAEDIAPAVGSLKARIAELEAEVARLSA